MSYDLLFVAPPGATIPPALDYFVDRPYYTLGADQALYEHPDTGVYFIFEPVSEHTEDDPDTWLQLNLNLYRPHYFGLEAADEIAALVQATGTHIYDPQDSDPAVRPFDAAAFLARYSDSNRKSYQALLAGSYTEGQIPPPDTLPTRALEALWRWNRNRTARNSALGEDVFVPRVMFLKQSDRILTTAVWTDAIPVQLPQVDCVIVYREQIHKRRWFGGTPKADMALVSWQELVPHLPVTSLQGGPLPFLDLGRLVPDPELRAYLRALPAIRGKPELVPADSVLNRELVP